MQGPKIENYIAHGTQLVKGWLSQGACRAIVRLSEEQQRVGVAGGAAEIGVHHGKLFILLYLLAGASESAVAIDLFSQQHLNLDHSGAGNLEIFKRNLAKFADLDRLVIHEGDSTLLSSKELVEMAHGPLRMISIDGSHTAEVTAGDLATSEAALCKGGIIILDDCFKEMWPGVVNGVHRHFAKPTSLVPFAIGENKTFFCHPEYAGRYSAALKRNDYKWIDQRFLGSPVVCFEYHPWSVARWWRKVDAFRGLRRLYHGLLWMLAR